MVEYVTTHGNLKINVNILHYFLKTFRDEIG